MKIGIAGGEGVGKSLLFLLWTSREGKPTKNHKGVVGKMELENPQFQRLVALISPKKVTLPTAEVIELLSTPERHTLEFLRQHLIGYDLVVYIFGVFQKPEEARLYEEFQRDLTASDEEIVEHIVQNLEKSVAKGQKEKMPELLFSRRILEQLKKGIPISAMDLTSEEHRFLAAYPFLSAIRMVYVLNVWESLIPDFLPLTQEGRIYATSILLESELMELEEKERETYLKAYGLPRLVLMELKQKVLGLCGRIFFYTIVGEECRAWVVPAGSTALEVASRIHSDLAEGFIKAEVVAVEDFLRAGSLAEAKRLGFLHLEGKDYVVKDGDILTIRFSKS